MHLLFQIIPKLFSGIEAGALCRSLEFFHSNFGNPCIHGPCFPHGHCHAETGLSEGPLFKSRETVMLLHTKTLHTIVCFQFYDIHFHGNSYLSVLVMCPQTSGYIVHVIIKKLLILMKWDDRFKTE